MKINKSMIINQLKPYLKLLPYSIRKWLRSKIEVNPLRINTKEYKKLAQSPRFLHTTATVLGKTIQLTDPFWYLYTYIEIFHEQIYKFRSKNTHPYIIDCGSNIGLSIIYFKYLYPNAKIVGFEPDPAIFEVLQSNLVNFGYSDVGVHKKAVWKEVGNLNFQPDGSVGGRLSEKETTGQVLKVPTIRLRDYLNEPVDFLKIDIEGAEYEVIRDCADHLRYVDHLFVEFHGKPDERQSLHDILNILQESGFRYHLKNAYPINHPFIEQERSKYYDLQVNVFAYRVKMQ